MIVLKEIKKIYQAKNSPQVIALKNINLTLEDQGLVFITGKSGCGKSTLLNILGGLDSPTSGAIYIQNQNMNHWNDKELDSYRNSYVGFIFQEFHVLNAYNVYDNIRLAKELKQEKISDQELDAYLDKVSLTGLGKRKMNELSGGQKQRVALLRALVKKPYLILADEPTGNLDTYNSDIIFKLLKEISKTKLVIVVTHDVESALKYGDRLIELKDGSIIDYDKELFQKYLYNDYTNLNIRLLDEYDMDLSLFSNPICLPQVKMDEIPVDRLQELLDSAGLIIENSKTQKAYLFDVSNVKEFITVSTDLICGEINKIRG